MRSVLLAVALILGSAAASWATGINVGQLSFSNDGVGDIYFTLINSTGAGLGEDVTGGFPVSTPLDFTSVTLTVYCSGTCGFGTSETLTAFDDATTTVTAGNLNFWTSFSSTDTFSQAVLTLNFGPPATLAVDGPLGPSFVGSSSASVTLSDPGGQLLDGDFAVVVDPPGNPGTTVPEPATSMLLVGGLSGLFLFRGFSKRK